MKSYIITERIFFTKERNKHIIISNKQFISNTQTYINNKNEKEQNMDKEQFIKIGNHTDSEIEKTNCLKNMWNNIKELENGLLDTSSPKANVGSAIGAIGLGVTTAAFGSGTLVALGAGAIGFVVGKVVGKWCDLMVLYSNNVLH